ncbi:carbonic anhydrase [Gimesia maris]|jgi:hypothetical protein|tara:strand:+ start:4281 stop:4790 length:510 start_codon:yes stop_codon:yes gene_type:complete
MKNFNPRSPALFLVAGALAASLRWPLAGAALDKTPDSGTHKHVGQATDADNDLPAQLRELKARGSTLEAALRKRYPGTVGKDASGDKGMVAMDGGGMAMMGRIRPAIELVDRQQEREQRVAAAIKANTRASVKLLRQVSSIAAATNTKNVKVVGAVYQVDSGIITFLEE